MPPLAADDAFLILEFVAGHRLVPHPVFTALLSSLPSFSPRSSPRLRKGLALRALDATLPDPGKARALLADPDLSSCFPGLLSPSLSLPDLSRLLDVEWSNLPPSTLEIAADRIAGAGALRTWATADHAKREKLRLLVGETTEREILGKLAQNASTPHPPIAQINEAAANAPNTTCADETYNAQQGDEANLAKKNGKADHALQDSLRHQEKLVEGAPDTQAPEKLVTNETTKEKGQDVSVKIGNATAFSHMTGQFSPDNNKNHALPGSKRSLMETNPTASTHEWDGLGGSDHERLSPKRRLPTFEKKPKPSPTFPHKTRKKWSEMQEKTLIEGVEKYGKGNWKDIKMAYPNAFQDRSTVDLKDKFRNMERHQCV